jgi:transcriptional regulator with XRE-family HTH domain
MDKVIDSLKIARSIRSLRERLCLTQVEMADILGYSERQMRRLETEGTLNLQVLNIISQAFEVSVWDILTDRVS